MSIPKQRNEWYRDPSALRAIGTVLAGVVGAASALFGAEAAISVVLTLLTELLALQLAAAADAHQRHQELVRNAEGSHKQLLSSNELLAAVESSGGVSSLLSRIAKEVGDLNRNGHPFFAEQAAHLLSELEDRLHRCTMGELVLTEPSRIQLYGIELLNQMRPGDRVFATSLIELDNLEFWLREHGPDYLASHKAVIDAGVSITRVFILQNAEELGDQRIRHVLESNRKVGVNVMHVLARLLGSDDVRDFGIFDSSPPLVCYLSTSPFSGQDARNLANHSNAPGSTNLEARYFTSRHEVAQARERAKRIEHAATPFSAPDASGVPSGAVHDLDLLASAISMEQSSPHTCVDTFGIDGDCRWYHSSWQYLRCLDLVETPRTHDAFFRRAVANFSSKSALEILICGLADQEMLALLYDALVDPSSHTIKVIDLCPTPLQAARLWAERKGVAVDFARMDARRLDLPAASVDLVVTDAFLTKLPPDDQARVIAEWARVVRQGRHVLTTVKVNDGSADPVRADEASINGYVERAGELARRLETPFSPFLSIEKAKSLAGAYARRNVSFPIPTADAIASLFIGFEVDVVGSKSVTEYRTTGYAQVIARRLDDTD